MSQKTETSLFEYQNLTIKLEAKTRNKIFQQSKKNYFVKLCQFKAMGGFQHAGTGKNKKVI